MNTKTISYKEDSDYTDEDDLVPVGDGTSAEQETAAPALDENGQPIALLPPEEEGELIEKILEHRMGLKGATGLKTTRYQVEEHGDPNVIVKKKKEVVDTEEGEVAEDEDPVPEEEPERELQFLIKWKNFSYIHCTWESRESLAAEKARGVKKIENYIKREEEIKHW